MTGMTKMRYQPTQVFYYQICNMCHKELGVMAYTEHRGWYIVHEALKCGCGGDVYTMMKGVEVWEDRYAVHVVMEEEL